MQHCVYRKTPEGEETLEIDDLLAKKADIHIEQLDNQTIWMSIDNHNYHFYIHGRRLVLKWSWDN